ncbi:MAG: M20/M25/M40 family metallo-hydrolase [Candidatus Caldatribacteriota bacterium]|nr:M20/M25/M40 family metallo-hydrolase [Candidatus Caldatribacteriota bacterium]
MVNEKRLLNNFMDLVKIDSVSRDEKKVTDYLIKKINEMGLEVTVDQAGKYANSNSGNIIIRLKGNVKNVPTIMFAAHTDTVSPGKNIQPVCENGKIFSSGNTILGADDKAGVAIILETLELIREKNLPCGNIEIVFSICEEIGLLGAKNLDMSHLKAEMAFILDSDGDAGEIITTAPFHNSIKIIFHGKAAHSGANPEKGINAIQTAGVALSRMKLGRIDEETTANIGIIYGGKATNIVPDEVTLKGEIRSLDEKKLEYQTEQFKKICENTAKEFKAKISMEIGREYYGYHFSPQSQIIKIAQKAARDIELPAILRASGGGSDVNVLNKKGLPSVDLGIGMKKVHTVDEYILIKNMIRSTEFLLSIISTVVSGEM